MVRDCGDLAWHFGSLWYPRALLAVCSYELGAVPAPLGLPSACHPLTLGPGSLDHFTCVCREERNQTQVLRQQQDEAYLASLRADQEKERKKKEERERKKKKEEEVQQQKLAEERRRQVRAEGLQQRLQCPVGCLACSLAWGLSILRGSWSSCAAGDRHKGHVSAQPLLPPCLADAAGGEGAEVGMPPSRTTS